MNKRPRILIDAIAYSPRDGGFTTALRDLLETCRRMPEFEFVVVHNRKHGQELRAFGLRTYSVAIPGKLRFFASLLLLPFVARRIRADAVHCEISALPRFVGIPGSVTVHDVYFLVDPRAGGQSFRQRVMSVYWNRVFLASVRRAQIVKAISTTTAEDLWRLVSPDLAPMVCEPRFVTPSGSAHARRPPEPDEEFRLLFVGNVIPRKNIRFLLQALQLVRRRWRLDVVGNVWSGASELEPVRDDPRVKVHGYLPDAERDRLMATAHLLVAPSHYEGFGYPAAEAMARGLAAFTSDVGAFREFVPPEWRFQLSDPSSLATMIDAIDEARYRDMPNIAQAAVARFSPDAHLERHHELFQRLVSAPPAMAEDPAMRSHVPK